MMLSLDKKILDQSSAVARRMVEYGKTEDIYIVIPDRERKTVVLSGRAQVEATGGRNKAVQLWNLYALVKKYLSENSSRMITAQDPFFLGLAALRLRSRFNILVEVQVHGDFFSSDYYRKGSIVQRARYYLGRYVVRHSDKVRVVGERVRQSVVAFGVAPEKVTVRPVPVNASAIRAYAPKFDLHARYPQFKKIFLALGRPDPVKNIAWLIDIFAVVVKAHPDWGLVVVGDGPEQKRLEALVKNKNLGYNIIIESWTNDPWSYLKTADCLLFPSLSEGHGLVVMEAIAAGTPVIMTDVGVANFEVKAGPQVVIMPVNDGEAFLQAIRKSV